MRFGGVASCLAFMEFRDLIKWLPGQHGRNCGLNLCSMLAIYHICKCDVQHFSISCDLS